MSVNSKIIAALADEEVGIVEPGIYTGSAETYYTFNFDSMGTNYADDEPNHERYLVQVHFFCPAGTNSLARRKLTKQRLYAAGFSWPSETQVEPGEKSSSSADTDSVLRQHYVYECELMEEVELHA